MKTIKLFAAVALVALSAVLSSPVSAQENGNKDENGKVVERVWKLGGMYGEAIEKIVYWLDKAAEVANPTQKEIIQAEKFVRAFNEAAAAGIGVFTVDGKMVDLAFIPGAQRTLKLAKACGMYEGDLV